MKTYIAQTSKKATLIVSFLAVLIFIFGSSLQNANVSGEDSRNFFDVLKKFFSYIPFFTHAFLRKAAHFTEYALLGVHLALFPSVFGQRKCREYFFSFGGGVCVAAMDESLQILVPGRYGSGWDVLLDSGGVLFGMTLVILVSLVRLKRRKQEIL